MKLYAYNQGSKSAKALADALNIKRIKHEGKQLRVPLLLNWGSSKIKRSIVAERILNKPEAVAIAANKLFTFQTMALTGVSIPDFTTDRKEALIWLGQGHTVVARLTLTGHSGEGIVIVTPEEAADALPNAPLYTKYVKKEEEYRLHVMHGQVHFQQRKARKKDVPDEQVNWKVRNLAGGFIFANQDVEAEDIAVKHACNAVASLGLDFGAVDIIRTRRGEWYVLEVNTACGLEGKNLDSYVENLKKFL